MAMAPRSVAVGASAARFAPPVAAREAGGAEFSALVDFVSEARSPARGMLVITGAGCSTESGIPDYRSPAGSYSKGHKPMLQQQFLTQPGQRARYWARSLKGYRLFARVHPNPAHLALAALERSGHVQGIVTQNVDRLHQKAGSRRVLELHGRGDQVECTSCGTALPRRDYQAKLEHANASWIAEHLPSSLRDEDVRADGDAHLTVQDFRHFHVPPCTACGGVVMPSIIFFGGSLRPEVKLAARTWMEQAGRILVLGSSCQVFSAYSLVKDAAAAGKDLALVNIGATRVDPLVPLQLPLRCGDAMLRVCNALGVPVPSAHAHHEGKEVE